MALYVTDIDQAVAYLEHQPGVQKFLGPFPVTGGPAAGQTINYFKTFFGLYLELISYPNGMAYETTATTRLWNPADRTDPALEPAEPRRLTQHTCGDREKLLQ